MAVKRIQWGRIKTAYLKGDCTYKDLADRYHVSEKTIRNRASNEGWGKEKDKVKAEVGQAIHARAVKARVEQLEKLIEANNLFIDGLLEIARQMQSGSTVLFTDDKGSLKNAESMSKAIQTAAMTQRDLYKLPTLDQDLRKKEEAQRKREAKEKMNLDKEKFEFEKSRKADDNNTGGQLWEIVIPEGTDAVDE